LELSDWLRVIFLGFLFFFRIFLATAETALLATNKLNAKKLEQEKVKGAHLLLSLLEHPSRFLPTILLLTLLVDVGAAALATTVASKYLPFGAAIATGFVTIIFFVYGELIPKTFAIHNWEKVGIWVAPVVSFITLVLYPLVFIFIKIANFFTRILGGKIRREGPFVTEDEIKTLVTVGEEEGVLEKGEKELIHSVFEFGDTLVREVMVPRMDMICLKSSTPLKKVLDTVIKEGHSRVPIYEETVDNITGIAHLKDLLVHIEDKKKPLDKLVRPAYFIPETKRVSELLRELQKKRQHMAIVVDEYGGTAGLVTIEDLVEEIVGEIFDEYDLAETMIEPLGKDRLRVDARINLDKINELFEVDLPQADYDTVGGFVYNLIGKIPSPGEKVEFDNLVFTVEKVEKRRISKILVSKKAVQVENN